MTSEQNAPLLSISKLRSTLRPAGKQVHDRQITQQLSLLQVILCQDITQLCQGEFNQTNNQPTKRTTSEPVQAEINFETCRKTSPSPRNTNHPATKSSASDSVPRHCTWLCQGESNQTNDQPTKRTTSEHVQAEINFETCRKTSSRQTNHPVLSLVQMIACPIIELGFARENSK